MANELPPAGTQFVTKPNPLQPRTFIWALIDKNSGVVLTEYRKDKKSCKSDYINKYGPRGHQPSN